MRTETLGGEIIRCRYKFGQMVRVRDISSRAGSIVAIKVTPHKPPIYRVEWEYGAERISMWTPEASIVVTNGNA